MCVCGGGGGSLGSGMVGRLLSVWVLLYPLAQDTPRDRPQEVHASQGLKVVTANGVRDGLP